MNTGYARERVRPLLLSTLGLATVAVLSPTLAEGQVNINAPCTEGAEDARTPFEYSGELLGQPPAYDPMADLLALIAHLETLGSQVLPSGVDVVPATQPPTTMEVSDRPLPPTPTAFFSVRDAATDLLREGNRRRATSSEFREMDFDEARGEGFRRAQEAALQSFEEHERLLLAEEDAFRAERSTLRSLCNNLDDARRLRTEADSQIGHVRSIDGSVNRWWRLTTAIRTELKAWYPGLSEEEYPLNEFPDLNWNGPLTRLQLDRGVPVLNGARALHRIDAELHSVHELAAFVDAELAADAAKSALVFARAVHNATAPSCDGDVRCLAPLQADVIAAEGAAAQAEARRRAARQRFDATLANVSTLPEFERRQREELNDFNDRLAAPGSETRDLAELIERAESQARASCRALAQYTGGDEAPCLEIREVLANHVVLPSIDRSVTWSVGDHAFSLFNSRVPEPEGYGAYTYVLFSKRKEAWEASADVAARYQALLVAIVDNTDSAAEAVLERDQLNLFAIPTVERCDPDLSTAASRQACETKLTNSQIARELENYDATLSRKYLAEARGGQLLRDEIISVLRDSPGPFLLTSRERLMDAKQREGYAPILLLDLSAVDPRSYEGYVRAYKQTVIDEPPDDQVVWEPPRPDWIRNAMLTVGQHVPKLIDTVKDMLAPGE